MELTRTEQRLPDQNSRAERHPRYQLFSLMDMACFSKEIDHAGVVVLAGLTPNLSSIA
jgi:hypothetical protein